MSDNLEHFHDYARILLAGIRLFNGADHAYCDLGSQHCPGYPGTTTQRLNALKAKGEEDEISKACIMDIPSTGGTRSRHSSSGATSTCYHRTGQ